MTEIRLEGNKPVKLEYVRHGFNGGWRDRGRSRGSAASGHDGPTTTLRTSCIIHSEHRRKEGAIS